MSDVDLICLVETWKHQESKVPNIEDLSRGQHRTKNHTVEGLEA